MDTALLVPSLAPNYAPSVIHTNFMHQSSQTMEEQRIFHAPLAQTSEQIDCLSFVTLYIQRRKNKKLTTPILENNQKTDSHVYQRGNPFFGQFLEFDLYVCYFFYVDVLLLITVSS